MNEHASHDGTPRLARELQHVLGPDRVLLSDDDRRFYSQDIAGPRAHVAACVAQPGTVEQLAVTVAVAAAAGHAIVPRGGGSSYTGG